MNEVLSEILKNTTAEELLKALLAGGNTNMLQLSYKNVTLEQGMTDYKKLVEFNLSPKSLKNIETVKRLILKYLSGNMIIGSIDKKAAENVIIKIAESAPKGIKTYLSTINAMFNVFIEWDYITTNPFQKIKLPKQQKEELKTFSDAELELVKNKLIEYKKPVIADMIVFSANTGLRGGEAVNLRRSDIDFRLRKLNVGSRLHKTKSRKIRVIPFNNTIEEILIKNINRYTAEDKIIREFVFTQRNGKPYQLDTISKKLKKAIRELNLDEDLHWHSLRHTAATKMVGKGAVLPVVQKILGHSSIQTTMIYTHTDLESLREAVERL